MVEAEECESSSTADLGVAQFRADVASCLLSALAQVLIGRKKWYGWAFNILNFIPLTIINLHYHLWAFHFYNAVMTVLLVWNGWRWYRDSRS